MNSNVRPCCNAQPSLLYESHYSNISHLVYLDKEYLNKKKKFGHDPYTSQFSPYKKARATSTENREIRKIHEFQTIEDFRNNVDSINKRLANYELELIVRYKEL